MPRLAIALLCTLALLLAAACGGDGEEAEPTAVPTPAESPFQSGALPEEAPTAGTYVVDLAAERWFRVLPEYNSEAPFIAVSPDGSTIVSKDEGGLVALDVADGSERRVLDAPNAPYGLWAAFSPDGDALAVWTTVRGPVKLLAWPEGTLVVDVPGPTGAVAWAGDTLVVGAGDSGASLVSLDGTIVEEPDIPSGATPFVGTGGDLRFAFLRAIDPAYYSAGAILFTIEPGGEPEQIAEFRGEAVGPISWSPDGALLALRVSRPAAEIPGSQENDIRVIDGVTGETRFTITTAGCVFAAWSPTEPRLLFDTFSSSLMVVDGDGENLRALLQQGRGSPLGNAWSPDGREVATSSAEEGALTIIDVDSGDRRTLIRGPDLITNLQWLTADRLVFTTIPGVSICQTTVGGETRVVFP